MDRQPPSAISDEIDLYIRTYYSLLKSSGEVRVRAFEEAHSFSESSLHAGARDATPDVAAFAYSSGRLPSCMPQVRRLVLGQSHEQFEAAGLSVRAYAPVGTRGRRRPLRWDGEGTLAAFITSTSDIDDLVPIVTAYQIEWNKIHRRLSCSPRWQRGDATPDLLAEVLGLTPGGVATLIEALGAVPAGAFLVDGTAARVRAEEDFATSEVASLLGRAPTDEANTRTVAGVPRTETATKVYDAENRQTQETDATGAVRRATYDAAGRVATSTDALNRVTSKIVPERSGLNATHTRDVYYGYDLRGLQTYARFDSAVGEGVTNTYDGFGRLTASALTMDGVTRSIGSGYDADGNRTQQTFADGQTVTYNYDGLDRPLSILRSGSAAVASYGYDAAGRRTAFNGGFSTSYAYDPAGRLSTLTNNLPANTWNNQWSFGYNPAGQIINWTRSNDMFAFAAIFNVNRPYTANGLNQYTGAGSVSFSYDANGNLTGDGVNAFTYDVENRLVAAIPPVNMMGYMKIMIPAMDPAQRFQTAEEMRERIMAAASQAAADRAARMEEFGPDAKNYVERSVLLQTLDLLSEMGEGGTLFADGIESDRVEFASGQSVKIRVAERQLRLVVPEK